MAPKMFANNLLVLNDTKGLLSINVFFLIKNFLSLLSINLITMKVQITVALKL